MAKTEAGEQSTDDLEVHKDITGESRGTGEYEDFESLFLSRYQKISDIISSRINFQDIDIRDLDRYKGKKVEVTGLVFEKLVSRKGNKILKVEDETDETLILFPENQNWGEVVPDEVIGVRGTYSEDGGIIFADEIIFPEVPSGPQSGGDRDVEAAFVSDLHVGSQEFRRDRWNEMSEWLNSQSKLEYLFVAGDIVDGIGVFPGQEDELEIPDIEDQYRRCAECFSELRNDIEIITITGNHDSVRIEEPQPAVPDEFREYFNSNVEFYRKNSECTPKCTEISDF